MIVVSGYVFTRGGYVELAKRLSLPPGLTLDRYRLLMVFAWYLGCSRDVIVVSDVNMKMITASNPFMTADSQDLSNRRSLLFTSPRYHIYVIDNTHRLSFMLPGMRGWCCQFVGMARLIHSS